MSIDEITENFLKENDKNYNSKYKDKDNHNYLTPSQLKRRTMKEIAFSSLTLKQRNNCRLSEKELFN